MARANTSTYTLSNLRRGDKITIDVGAAGSSNRRGQNSTVMVNGRTYTGTGGAVGANPGGRRSGSVSFGAFSWQTSVPAEFIPQTLQAGVPSQRFGMFDANESQYAAVNIDTTIRPRTHTKPPESNINIPEFWRAKFTPTTSPRQPIHRRKINDSNT